MLWARDSVNFRQLSEGTFTQFRNVTWKNDTNNSTLISFLSQPLLFGRKSNLLNVWVRWYFAFLPKVEESVRRAPIEIFTECLIVPIFHSPKSSKIVCEYGWGERDILLGPKYFRSSKKTIRFHSFIYFRFISKKSTSIDLKKTVKIAITLSNKYVLT